MITVQTNEDLTVRPDETWSIKKLWEHNYKRWAYWKACPYSPTNPSRILDNNPKYPLGCFVHLLK